MKLPLQYSTQSLPNSKKKVLTTFWVYENIRKQYSFYNKLDILLLLSSGYLWKKHHPQHHTTLHCDILTKELLVSLNCTSIWDEINILPENKFIDKSIFWASSKLERLRNVKGPSIIMDHDFLVYKNLDQYLNEVPLFAHEENGEQYYPTAYDPFIKAVHKIVPRPQPHAINCCFSYFPDFEFANYYAKSSLDLMVEFTKLKVPNSKYLIFAEQLLLKYLLDFHKIEYHTLLNEKWNAKGRFYEPSKTGIMSFEESQTVFRHYWMDKPSIKDSKDGYDLIEEVRILKNILSPLSYINFKVIDDFKH